MQHHHRAFYADWGNRTAAVAVRAFSFLAYQVHSDQYNILIKSCASITTETVAQQGCAVANVDAIAGVGEDQVDGVAHAALA